MALASPPTAVAELRRWLERVEAHGRTEQAVLPFGLDAIDRPLPQGGLPLGHLHEVIEAGAAGVAGDFCSCEGRTNIHQS